MSRVGSEECIVNTTKCCKMSLSFKQQIYLVILIPAILNCLIYVIHFATDLVVAIQHFKENNIVWGCCTLGFMYLPPLVYFLLNILRPDWWMTDDNESFSITFSWLLSQLNRLITFPLFALWRHASLIVLSVDALRLDGDKRKKAINLVLEPAAIELYFFLQAWFQALPQSLFQTNLYFLEIDVPRTTQTRNVQLLCIIISIYIIAVKTTAFQNYESQKVSGRKLPWATWLSKYKEQELQVFEQKKLLHLKKIANQKVDNLNEQCQNNGSGEKGSTAFESLEKKSVTPPLPPKNVKIKPPPTPLRRVTSNVRIPIPDAPAPPRPDSIASEDDKIVKENLDSSQNEEDVEFFKRVDDNRSKRENYYVNTVDQDLLQSISSFLWWLFYIFARVLTIAIFLKVFPMQLFVILGIHYLTVICYLFYNSKYLDRASFFINLWLGYVYIFAIIEFRAKFLQADKILVFYHSFMFLENILLTIGWYSYGSHEHPNYQCACYIVFISMGFCISFSFFNFIRSNFSAQKIYST